MVVVAGILVLLCVYVVQCLECGGGDPPVWLSCDAATDGKLF